MSGFTLPTSRPITQAWAAEFDDWDGDGVVDYPGGFYHSIGWDGHNGIDYGCYVGDPVEAVADGIVTFAGNAGNWHPILSGGGNAILVEHPEYGVQTEYLHLSAWLINAGDTVARGQVIGHAGKTGAATAPHLHLGMLRINGYNLGDRWRGRIDPTPYLYGTLNPAYPAGIAAMGSTITPQEEGFLMALSDQDQRDLQAAVGRIDNFIQNPQKILLSLQDQRDIQAAIGRVDDWAQHPERLIGVVTDSVIKAAPGVNVDAIRQAIAEGLAAGIKVDVKVGK